MKAMLVVIDGLADNKIAGLGNRTTFASASHRYMDRLASEGFYGYLDACPAGYVPESMVCILNLLGISKEFYPTGRASLEALSAGYPLGEDEVVLRCNLVSVDNKNRLSSFNGGSLTKREMKRASEHMAKAVSQFKFIPLADYRNLLILEKKYFTCLDAAASPPHECLGENMEELLTDIFSSSEMIKDFINSSGKILREFNNKEHNYLFYPWGISSVNHLPSFHEMYKRKAAAVCCADIARGIALALGMYAPKLEGVTGDTDTDLQLKAKTACSLLADYEFVFVHINGTDEAAHRNDYLGKVKFIERIDEEFVGYLLANTDKNTKVMICTDHATDPLNGKHVHLPVPFFIRESFINGLETCRQIRTPADALQYLLSE
jgi:2,3-bisphosphoglycerate-independent phosphoglycerate mutase